mgnify:CR=1 FL=1
MTMEDQFRKEKSYLKAQKRVKDIKGFYYHLFVTVLALPIVIGVNLMFSPGFHWFWFATIGMLTGILIHWFVVFGVKVLGFGSDWEENKIKELMGIDEKNNN